MLMLHGFWFGSWAWSEVSARLVAGGRRTLAVDMAGHGLRARRPTARPDDAEAFAGAVSPVGDIDLDAAAALLVGQIEALATDGPVVVAAHSAGGTVATRAVQSVPHLVSHMVYVAAYMLASDVPLTATATFPEQEGEVLVRLNLGDAGATGAFRLNPFAQPEELRAAFCADLDQPSAHAATALMSPDAPLGIGTGATTLTKDGWGSVPRTYVVCSRDVALRPATQRRMIAEADAAFPATTTAVVELDSSHTPMLSAPGPLADVLASIR